MVKVNVCKTCGHPLPEYEALLDLTRLQQRLFAIVQKAGKAGIDAESIMQRLYGNDPTGGPDSANILSVMKNGMTKALQKHGMKIVCRRGPGALWTLEKI